MTTWEFAKKGNQRERNPVQDEFFNAPDTLTDVSALVRESIQNSLDARLDDSKPVRVVFTLGQKLSGSGHNRYFDGLQGHLDAVFGKDKAVNLDSSMNYLLVEDFNTTGLTGASNKAEVPSGTKPSDSSYIFFIHIEGEGSKGDGKRGKWGVGKIVFPRMSAAKSFFAFSTRSAENAPDGRTTICIGQSILKFHDFKNERVQPDGWFGTSTDEVFKPLDDDSTKEFAKFWNLTRGHETGLSIVIPYVNESVTQNEIRDAIVRQYFVAILEGSLVCEINSTEGDLLLDKTGLISAAPKIEMTKAASSDRTAEEMKAAISLVAEAVDGETEIFRVTVPDTSRSASDIVIDEDDLGELSSKLKSGKPVKVVVSIKAPSTQTPQGALLSDEFVILFQLVDGIRSASIFSREGIIIPGTKNQPISGFSSVVLIGSGPLANVLGLSEGPAHEKWSADTKNFRETFGSNWKATRLISISRNLPHKLISWATSQSGTFDNHALDKWLLLEKLSPPIVSDPPIVPGPTPPPKPEPPNNPSIFSVHTVKGGFVIGRGEATLKTGSIVRVKTAYARARGNPFKNWKAADFILQSGFTFETANVKDLVAKDNVFNFVITGDKWEVRCTGFSSLLDLEVFPDWFEADSGDGEFVLGARN
jgi:hypothetical protein